MSICTFSQDWWKFQGLSFWELVDIGGIRVAMAGGEWWFFPLETLPAAVSGVQLFGKYPYLWVSDETQGLWCFSKTMSGEDALIGGCSSLVGIALLESVTAIGNAIIAECSSLEKHHNPSVRHWLRDYDAFPKQWVEMVPLLDLIRGCSLVSIAIPESVVASGQWVAIRKLWRAMLAKMLLLRDMVYRATVHQPIPEWLIFQLFARCEPFRLASCGWTRHPDRSEKGAKSTRIRVVLVDLRTHLGSWDYSCAKIKAPGIIRIP